MRKLHLCVQATNKIDLMFCLTFNLFQFPNFIHTQKRNPKTHLKVGMIESFQDYS